MSADRAICLIGFGEVGQILATDLAQCGYHDLRAWDVLFTDPTSAPSRGLAAGSARAADNLADALNQASVVISAVTAARCAEVARSAATWLKPQALYLDLNSVSPGVRYEAESLVTNARGRYVEAAVMSAIRPRRIATPMLLGGPQAAKCQELLHTLGFAGATVFSDVIGLASAAKMCRSVVVKGLEALLTESLLSARRFGVEETVLASLSDVLPGADRRELSRYMISRSLLHGRRRAEEMREVARTVREVGLVPHMSIATAAWQDASGHHAAAAHLAPLGTMLDTLLASLQPVERESC